MTEARECVAIVTGAASGIGRATAKLLAPVSAGLVLLALAVTAWLLLGGKGADEGAQGGAEAASAPAGVPVAIYASLGDKFVVTLHEQGRQRYFQTSLSALTRDEAVAPTGMAAYGKGAKA